jgi:hypothetical protein
LGEEYLDADAIGGHDDEWDKALRDGKPAKKDGPPEPRESSHAAPDEVSRQTLAEPLPNEVSRRLTLAGGLVGRAKLA